MVAKSREMLGAKGGAAGWRSEAEAQRAKEEVQQMAAELQKKAERLKEAKAAVNREKRAASVAKQQAVRMRRELEEIGVNLERERSKRELLQQANERLKWKLHDAERRAEDASFAAAEVAANGSFASMRSNVSRHRSGSPVSRGRRRPATARGAALAQPKGGRGTLKAKPPTLQRLDLHQAASAGDCRRIKQLLDEGWHVDGLNAERETALHWAANLGQTKAVQLLLRRFADPTLKDRWGHTAAAQALNKGHYAVADMLEEGEDRWDEIKEEREEQVRIEVSQAPQTDGEEHPLEVFVSHNRGDEPLQMPLPRGTTYSDLIRLLHDELCEMDGGDIEELVYNSDGLEQELLPEDFEKLVGPHVERPFLQLKAVVSTSDIATRDNGWSGPDPDAELDASEVADEASRQERLEKIQQEVPNWNAADVETWLVEVVQLPEYVQVFRENEVDGELLLWLQELNLHEDLEITSPSHRKRIAEQIDVLRPPDHPSAPMDIASPSSPEPPGQECTAAAQVIQARWRGHATRAKYAKPVNIIRRFEQLKGGAADEPDEQDLAEEVRSELAFIGEQLREQLANSKAQPPSSERPSSALSELREFNSELASNSMRSSPPPAEAVASSPLLLPAAAAESTLVTATQMVETTLASTTQAGERSPSTTKTLFDETSPDSPGFLPRPEAVRTEASPALLPGSAIAPRMLTELDDGRISVTIHDQGKLGLNFGSGGATWPLVESIAQDGLVAHFPEITAVCAYYTPSCLATCLYHAILATETGASVCRECGLCACLATWERRMSRR